MRTLAAVVLSGLAGFMACAAAPREPLRVCADPNNLPFSNDREEGLDNRIAELLARELGTEVEYTWWPQRRAFLRHTLAAGKCDVVIGVPASSDMLLTTRPIYRSTYVFVHAADAAFAIDSFEDPDLHTLRIGVHIVGDDFASTPPAHALANRGIVENVTGYRIYGDYSEPHPPTRILDALAAGEIDVAIVWGPLAGWYAPRLSPALRVVPVLPQIDLPFLPFVWDIAAGVRREDSLLHRRIDDALVRLEPAVDRILEMYGVPLFRPPAWPTAATAPPVGSPE